MKCPSLKIGLLLLTSCDLITSVSIEWSPGADAGKASLHSAVNIAFKGFSATSSAMISIASGFGLRNIALPSQQAAVPKKQTGGHDPVWAGEYDTVCELSGKFSAEAQYLRRLSADEIQTGLEWIGQDVDEFLPGPHPGGFTPEDEKPGMRILRMKYADLPGKVRKWIEDEKNVGQKRFLVLDEDVIFSPGTYLNMIPLFVGGDEGAECGGAFMSLDKYGVDFGGERVTGELVRKSEEENVVSVEVRARLWKRKASTQEDAKSNDHIRDEL